MIHPNGSVNDDLRKQVTDLDDAPMKDQKPRTICLVNLATAVSDLEGSLLILVDEHSRANK